MAAIDLDKWQGLIAAIGRSYRREGPTIQPQSRTGYYAQLISREDSTEYQGFMSKQRVLTGITTTGTPHLGNYVGAIRPAIAASQEENNQSFYFLADYHALIKCQDPEMVHQSTREIAATWLALGLNTDALQHSKTAPVSWT